MDRSCCFFYALEKTRGAKKHITCLLAEDGTPLTEPVEITDYKIVAKAISLQLGSVLADVIHTDQTYTVPDHSIFDNLFMVRNLLELGHRDGLSFALQSLDQEKAFNRVDHGYLLSTLQAFGFGPQFVGFLRVLYTSAEFLIKLNWTLTKPISFGRGVRQGCSLSGQLYTLAIEPFLCLLCRRLTALVLRELELQLVLSAYADVMLLGIQDPGDLARVEACQAIYSAASSARVNWVKSSGLADPHECLVLGGDFNITLEERDRLGTEQSPAAADVLLEIVEHHSLVDVWRDHHPDDISTFTFVRIRGASQQRDTTIEQLEREVLELERRLATSPEDPPLCGACREKREELRALEDHRARGAFVRSRICLFFYALEKRRGAKKHVTCILAEDGTPLTDPVEMCGRARAFYASLFSPDPTDPNACRVLWEELPTVSAGDREWLMLPLTLAEFSEALRRMPTNKSPGLVRLTVEFYSVFWDVLDPDLVTVWAESLQNAVVPLSCRRAVLALLPKKGDLRNL
ncbi:unnamed protein product [Caretta caretta]